MLQLAHAPRSESRPSGRWRCTCEARPLGRHGARQEARLRAAGSAMTQGARVPVLLVDDTHANLVALEAVVASDDYELVSVSSGEEAFRAVQERDFAVVLLDVQMPPMDAFETAERVR